MHFVQQEQQRVAVGPEMRLSLLFARCRPTQPRRSAARVGKQPATAAAAAVYGQFDD